MRQKFYSGYPGRGVDRFDGCGLRGNEGLVERGGRGHIRTTGRPHIGAASAEAETKDEGQENEVSY
jgi:hypothetical protein